MSHFKILTSSAVDNDNLKSLYGKGDRGIPIRKPFEKSIQKVNLFFFRFT